LQELQQLAQRGTDMTPDQLQSAVLALIAGARLKSAGGLTVSEFGSLTVEVIRLAVAGLDTINTLDGAAKKSWALSCVGTLFDAVADSCVPTLAWPVWFILRPAVRVLVLSAAGGALEQILVLTRAAAPEPVA
jgi:hypothetical protein